MTNKFMACVPDRIYKDSRLEAGEIVAYVFMQMIFSGHSKFTDSSYINEEILYLYMYGGTDGGTKTEQRIKNSIAKYLQGLVDKGVVQKLGLGYNPVSFVREDKEYYTTVPIAALQRILQSGISKKMELCLYLIWMLGTRNVVTKVSNQKIEYFANCVDVSERTIQRYNAALEELGIVEIERSENVMRSPGGYLYKENNSYKLSSVYT